MLPIIESSIDSLVIGEILYVYVKFGVELSGYLKVEFGIFEESVFILEKNYTLGVY